MLPLVSDPFIPIFINKFCKSHGLSWQLRLIEIIQQSLKFNLVPKSLQAAEGVEGRSQELLDAAGCEDVQTSDFKRYGSARKLYNFNVDNVDAY